MSQMPSRPLPALSEEQAAYSSCVLCEFRCHADRFGDRQGACGAGSTPRVYRHGVEYGEEPSLLPCNVVYLGGCDLRCSFCIAEEHVSHPEAGIPLDGELLRKIIENGQRRGAATIQFSGGQPTLFAPTIVRLLTEVKDRPRVVWKSNLHETIETLGMLEGVVDVFLADLKFGCEECAGRISRTSHYIEMSRRNLRWMTDHRETIVRHLVLPGHGECCLKPLLRLLADEFGGVPLSLRDGYVPGRTSWRHRELSRPLTNAEFVAARRLALDLRLNLVP